MKKKILIISIVVVLVFMLVAGAVGIVFMIRGKNQKILKTEINGIIFETIGYGERNDLRLIDDEYNYSLITEVELSITNTNSTQFSFQPKLLSMDLNDGYHFNFSSVKNTATNEIITDKNDMITIPAGSQIVFEFVFRRGEGDTVGLLNGDEEQMKTNINHTIGNDKKTFGNKTKFTFEYLSTVLAKATIYMNYHSAETLIDYVNGRTIL